MRKNLKQSVLGSTTLCVALSTFASAATFPVTNTNDSGPGSLRQAIVDANNNTGADTILFGIPGAGVHTVVPAVQLPSVTSPVTIDGSTQPEFTGQPLIEISGAILGNNGNAFVIDVGSDGTILRSLTINTGWSTAVFVQANNVVIEGCYLGTDSTGLLARSNTQGINANFGFNVSGMRIGGTTVAARNLISGNAIGVVIQSGSNNIIQGNFIGTDVTGTAALANNTDLDVRSDNNLIGGTTAAARNIIAGNGNSEGIVVGTSQGAVGNRIQGNFIGTDVTGTKALGFANAVFLSQGASLTTVGGLTTAPGTPPGNVIAGSGTGVFVSQRVTSNTIQGNLIGTDASGATALGNSLEGITIQGPFNVVGGTDPMARNVIAASGRHGIAIGTDNEERRRFALGQTRRKLNVDLGPVVEDPSGLPRCVALQPIAKLQLIQIDAGLSNDWPRGLCPRLLPVEGEQLRGRVRPRHRRHVGRGR